jgi:hypothetical protein
MTLVHYVHQGDKFIYCWAHLAGFRAGKKILWVSDSNKIYSMVSVPIGGRDGVDCSKSFWMTCSIYKASHPNAAEIDGYG